MQVRFLGKKYELDCDYYTYFKITFIGYLNGCGAAINALVHNYILVLLHFMLIAYVWYSNKDVKILRCDDQKHLNLAIICYNFMSGTAWCCILIIIIHLL